MTSLTLWDSILPPELLVLPVELGRVDALLDDAAFFTPFALYFDARLGRPSIPVETSLRLMFLKFRYRRVMLERCFDGDLVMVASPPHISASKWAFEYVYQTGGLPAGGAATRLLSRRRRHDLYHRFMARDLREDPPGVTRVWAYPLWCSVIRSESADAVAEDVDWWMRCIGDADPLAVDQYSRFAYLSGALTEFRTPRLRSAPLVLRVLLRAQYRPATLTLNADRIGPGLLIQHGVATIVTAESIGAVAGSISRSPSGTTPPAADAGRSGPRRRGRGGAGTDHTARRRDNRGQCDGDSRRRTGRLRTIVIHRGQSSSLLSGNHGHPG